MTREDITKQFPDATKEQIKALLDIHSADIDKVKGDTDAMNQQISAKDTEITGLKEQLTQRDKDIKALQDSAKDASAIQQQLTDLQTKYNDDTKALNKKLADQQNEFNVTRATEKFFSGVEFSSTLAKDAAMAQFKAKGFKLDGETFQGGKEWLEALKKEQPDAFKAADPEPTPTPPKPKFTNPITPPGGKGDENPFSFNFTPVRSVPKQ